MSGIRALAIAAVALIATAHARSPFADNVQRQAQSAFLTRAAHRQWRPPDASQEPPRAKSTEVIRFEALNEYLSAVFTFQVAQKLRQGRPLLDAGVPSADMQESSHSHFVGYLGEAFDTECRPRLEAAVAACQAATLPVAECAARILREFMAPLLSSFSEVEVMEPKIALDRELQVLYSADLAASYIILFCPLKVRHELYRYLWGHGAFLDGSVNWLCCPWVLNRERHDPEYHKLSLDLDSLSNEEIIDVIRLHKHYLSTDYVKQRSRKALQQLDRRSLLSVFQSVMLRVLWGNEAVTENTNNQANDNFIQSTEDLERIKKEVEEGEYKKETIRMNTLRGWLDEYRSKRGAKAGPRLPKPKKLQLRETEYARQMKRSIAVITRHIEQFNEAFRGVAGDTPFTIAARRHCSDALSGTTNISDDITINRIRQTFNVLLDFYRGNLASNAELYGHVPNLQCLKLLKFLLTYEKHNLTALLSALLLALPEFRPIANVQDFAQYATLPFNTMAKLCFIAIMRINPGIANMDMGVELDEAEVQANSGLGVGTDSALVVDGGADETPTHMSSVLSDSGSATEGNSGSETDSDTEGETERQAAAKGVEELRRNMATMIFTSEELGPVGALINLGRSTIVEARVGDEDKRCMVLDSRRTRAVAEAIILHLSNYDAVFEMLSDRDIEAPVEDLEDKTLEAIRKHKLAAVVKRMTDEELDELYAKVIKSAKLHEEFKIPDDIYKLTYHCALDKLEDGIEDDQVYAKITELLTRMDNEDDGDMRVSSIQRMYASDFEDGDGSTTDDSDVESEFVTSEGDSADVAQKGQSITERGHYLNLLEGEDISAFLDDSYSSTKPEEMTDSELRRLGDQVLERIESSGACQIIHYNPTSQGQQHPFGLHAVPARSGSLGLARGNAYLQQLGVGRGLGPCRTPRTRRSRLFASPYDDMVGSTVATDVSTADNDYQAVEQRYGPGIFPKRSPDRHDFCWQYPETMPTFKLLRNRVDQEGTERYTMPWRQLGLSADVARAAVSWIRKCLLDVLGRSDHPGLEITPTEIQRMAIEHLLKGRDDVLIASNAASGKTLAYLLPIFQKLKEDEKLRLRHPNAPRALILVPSRELADQTLSVLKGLGHVVKLSSESVAGGSLKGRQRDHMKRLVDIVVATPERLLKMPKHVKLHKLQYVVLDEADTLLNEGFWPEVARVLDLARHPYRLVQVAASAKYLLHFEKVQLELAKVPNMKGLPNRVPEVNAKYLDRLTRCHPLVETAWVDRPNRGVAHEFRHLKGKDKGLELVNLIRYESARRCKKILVFCNSIPSCRAVEYILRDADLPATSLHGKIPIMQRRRYYEEFVNGSSGILVCSDLASRGLDFDADAAIMFDFPLNSMDYLKRCGRVGRMINNDAIAPRGLAISLVKKRDQNLATAIERSLRMPFFPISTLSRRKEDYNPRSGRLRYLTQAGGYFKLAKLLRQEELKGTYDYRNMDQYLESFKGKAREMYENSLKKLVLRRRRICKRRRILTRRLKLMKRYNRTIRLKQRIISQVDRNRRLKRFNVHSSMQRDDRSCPRMKDLRPIRAKILELKLMEDKMTRRLLERNDRILRKFINKTQLVARSQRLPEADSAEMEDRQLPLSIIQRAREKIGRKVKRICSLL